MIVKIWWLRLTSGTHIEVVLHNSSLGGNLDRYVEETSFIAHPHLLVQATGERFLPTLVTFNDSHWLNQL